jgi:Ca2+-binding EF-hand superfamily protein
MIRKADTDGDGNIDEEEFVAIMKKGKKSFGEDIKTKIRTYIKQYITR